MFLKSIEDPKNMDLFIVSLHETYHRLKFQPTQKCEDSTIELLRGKDIIGMYLEEHCEITCDHKNDRITTGLLNKYIIQWVSTNHFVRLTPSDVRDSIQYKGVMWIKSMGNTHYTGIEMLLQTAEDTDTVRNNNIKEMNSMLMP